MGRLKPLLDVGGRPMLLSVLDALLAGGAATATVVVRSELATQLSELRPAVTIALNDDPKSAMIDSVRLGMQAGARIAPPATGYVICPCDVAGLDAHDVRRCVEAFADTPDRIVIATYAGRRGHPIVIPASLAEVVRSPECDAGLNRLARGRPKLVREIACDSPATISNINTPDDYARLR